MSDVMHVVNGDIVAASLAEAELPGDIVVWADCLDQGPLVPGSDDEQRASRAGFLAGFAASAGGAAGAEAIQRQLAGWDAAIDAAAQEADEIVLWYEHDLFDQLALV